MTIVDDNYKFVCADVRCQGRIIDEGVWGNTSFRKALEHSQLNLPDPAPLLLNRYWNLEQHHTSVSFVLIRVDAFLLTSYCMKQP